jgi:hypothetical protein
MIQRKMVANSLTWWFQSLEKGTNIILYMTSLYHMNSYTNICLSNVWRAFESHQESQVLVFIEWCDDGTGVLTFVVKLKCIVLHTNLNLSEKLYPDHLRKTSVIIGNGYCLCLMTLFSWHELLIQRTLFSSFESLFILGVQNLCLKAFESIFTKDLVFELDVKHVFHGIEFVWIQTSRWTKWDGLIKPFHVSFWADWFESSLGLQVCTQDDVVFDVIIVKD